MKLPFTLLLLCLLSVHFLGLCQSKLTTTEKNNVNRLLKKGIELFETERSNDALESFKKAEAIDSGNWKINYWLAACFHDLRAYMAAEQYLNNAVKLMGEKELGNADFYELQGKVNHRLGQIENALIAYKKAAGYMGQKKAKEFGIAQYMEQCELVMKDRTNGISVLREPVSPEINTAEDEYAPILFNGGEVLFFTARRPETKGENLNPDDLRYFEDIYRANWNSTTLKYEMDYSFFNEINTNGFDALSYVNSSGTYALLTVNTAFTEKTTKSSDIFEIVSEDILDWRDPSMLRVKGINTDYFEGGTCLTEGCENGDFIIFISDRKADLSGLDLYTCTKSDAGYGEVRPLPKFINSPGNETTPWLTSDGKYLFFSSDELPGYGGYDVFYCSNEGGNWSKPINLGASVNTVNNDTHFRLTDQKNRGIYASVAEKAGFFSYDLFLVDLRMANFPFSK